MNVPQKIKSLIVQNPRWTVQSQNVDFNIYSNIGASNSQIWEPWWNFWNPLHAGYHSMSFGYLIAMAMEAANCSFVQAGADVADTSFTCFLFQIRGREKSHVLVYVHESWI